ncbi:unnamed protein product, partial [Laminaria digitata]
MFGSDFANTVSANKVYAIHGLILSGIELALTVGNADNEDAFQLNSFSDLIFGGSVLIEAVGFVFAMGMAVRGFLHPVAQGLVGVGVPAMVIVETLVVPGSHQEIELFCLFGLGAQSLYFLTFTVISWKNSPDSVPNASKALWVAIALVCATLLYACLTRLQAGHSVNNVAIAVFVAIPFVVEVSESALLFKSGSIPFVAYLLAVLNLVVIGPAAALV